MGRTDSTHGKYHCRSSTELKRGYKQQHETADRSALAGFPKDGHAVAGKQPKDGSDLVGKYPKDGSINGKGGSTYRQT